MRTRFHLEAKVQVLVAQLVEHWVMLLQVLAPLLHNLDY
jgi:hypothetical protein